MKRTLAVVVVLLSAEVAAKESVYDRKLRDAQAKEEAKAKETPEDRGDREAKEAEALKAKDAEAAAQSKSECQSYDCKVKQARREAGLPPLVAAMAPGAPPSVYSAIARYCPKGGDLLLAAYLRAGMGGNRYAVARMENYDTCGNSGYVGNCLGTRPSNNYYVVQMPKGRGFESTGTIGMMCVTKAKKDTTIEVNGMNRKVSLYSFLYWVGQ